MAALGLLALSACTEARAASCTGAVAPALRVAVVDTAGSPFCDATVTAREGSFAEQLLADDCLFAGAAERPGTYSVTVERGGHRATERAVKVAGAVCDVRTVQLTITVPD